MSKSPSFERALVGCRIIESTENYKISDQPLKTRPLKRDIENPITLDLYDDGYFWTNQVFGIGRSEKYRDKIGSVSFIGAILSEWVPRVPGLYWKPQSEILRTAGPEDIEYKSQAWITYKPSPKSRMVLGGIGTLRFPPDREGYRLATLTTTTNVSAGVPALISPEVWDFHNLGEGSFLEGMGTWQAMDSQWSSKFPSTKDIPRAYMLIEKKEYIHLMDREKHPTLIHPFTVMEYRRGSNELFDFVFASADTKYPNYRQQLEHFFDKYKDREERYGRYLLNADIIEPIWQADYNSPEDLQRADRAATAELRLIEARVKEQYMGKKTIDDSIRILAEVCDSIDRLKLISDDIAIPPAVWFSGGTLAESIDQFVDEVLRQDKITSLIDGIAAYYPNIKIG